MGFVASTDEKIRNSTTNDSQELAFKALNSFKARYCNAFVRIHARKSARNKRKKKRNSFQTLGIFREHSERSELCGALQRIPPSLVHFFMAFS